MCNNYMRNKDITLPCVLKFVVLVCFFEKMSKEVDNNVSAVSRANQNEVPLKKKGSFGVISPIKFHLKRPG